MPDNWYFDELNRNDQEAWRIRNGNPRQHQVVELEIYKTALQRIANLNCASCERYVAEADAIAVDALVAGENVDD
jgi:hypothetical protein